MNSAPTQAMDRKFSGAVRSGLVVGLAVLVAVILGSHLRLQASFKTVVDAPLRADAGDYFSYAFNLKHYGIYSRSKPDGHSIPKPDAVRSPGYPLLLAALMDDPPTNSTLLKIVIVQALIGVAVIVLVFLLARSFLPAGYAVLAALFTAISPHLVNAGVFVLTETLFSLCVVALVCLLARPALQHKPQLLLLSGLVLGLCTLVRPTMLYFLWVIIVFLYFHWPRKAATKASALLLLGMILSYGPWAARNIVQFGETSDPTLQINTLHHGVYPDFMYQDDPDSRGFPYRFDPRSPEISRSMGTVTQEIVSRFKAEPGRYLHWYLLGKPYYLWSWIDMQSAPIGSFTYPATESPYYDAKLFVGSYLAARILHWPLIIIGCIFCVLVWLPSARTIFNENAIFPARLCSVLLLYVTALHMVGAPFSRYSIPFLPEMYAVAMGGLYFVASAFRARITGRSKALSGA
jgi:4-amino-4-deoxy-L-arabinose transferase-like glycosyltransferase